MLWWLRICFLQNHWARLVTENPGIRGIQFCSTELIDNRENILTTLKNLPLQNHFMQTWQNVFSDKGDPRSFNIIKNHVPLQRKIIAK